MAKIHEIDGKKYVEVDRGAKVGEKVVGRFTGAIYNVMGVERDGRIFDNDGICVHKDNYNVLEPLKESPPKPDVHELLAHLARKVVSLEHQLTDTQRNVERHAEELAESDNRTKESVMRLRDDVNSAHRKVEMALGDIVMLDERTQPHHADVVTFEKFLDSVADKVAERLVSR